MSAFIFLIFIQAIFTINSNPSCKDNTNFCQVCNILLDLCAYCEKPDIFVPDEKGGCTGAKKCMIGKNYCNECDDDEKLCQICEKNYYPDENGGCAYSEGCEISYKGECLKCKEDFILIGKEKNFKFCKSLLISNFKNCKEINSETGFCNKCNKGYYLTSEDNNCIKVDNCKESIFENCISCNQGYYFNKKENKCIIKNDTFRYCKQTIDGKSCDKCDDGYFPDENGICINTEYCLESENLKCKKCRKGYFLSNNNVCTNTDNCEIANKVTSICTYCSNNYYLDTKNYKCVSNLEDGPYKFCKKVDKDECLKCELNYYLGEDSRCSNSQYCAESENGKCIECPDNYYLGLDNICTNVRNCIYSKFGSCLECKDGYYYNKFNKTCTKMGEKFLNCKSSCDDGEKCCECKNDFYLYENNSLCYDNTKENSFIKCALVDNSREKCIKCIEGYYLGSYDNKCSKIENCKIVENENICFECDKFYCLDVKKQECIDNDYLDDLDNKKYISCKKTNEEGTVCEQCLYGYHVNEEGYCVDDDICEEREKEKCSKCKDIISENGYKYCANEIFGCLESAHENCLRCDNLENLYECTECQEGFKNSINGCIKED